MSDVVSGLLARLEEIERIAREAGGGWEQSGPESGERWHWVRSGHYDPLCDQPVDLGDGEFIAEGSPLSLRSIDEYPTATVGPLPHFVVIGAEEQEPGPARHIVMHDPASVLRLCRAHRDIIGEYREAQERADEDPGNDVARIGGLALLFAVKSLARGLGVEEQGSE